MHGIDLGRRRGDDRVAPVFRLLGQGLLTPAEVDALTERLLATRLPAVPAARLALARQIAHGPRVSEPAWAPLDWLGGARRLEAALTLEQRPWLAAVGVRGAGSGISRLLFAVEQYEVVVQSTSRPQQPGLELTGQVLRAGHPVASAAIMLAGPSQRAETEADAEGSFRFGGVATGSYELDVWAGDDLIVCTPVVLGGCSGRP